jgi:hypothetical protein
MVTIADHKKEAEAHVLYEKDKQTKIATITFNRLDKHNTATIGMRARFGELVFKANIDDDVKVLVMTSISIPRKATISSSTSRSMIRTSNIRRPAATAISTASLIITPRDGRATGRCRNSRRSVSSRPRAIATAGISTSVPTPT